MNMSRLMTNAKKEGKEYKKIGQAYLKMRKTSLDKFIQVMKLKPVKLPHK